MAAHDIREATPPMRSPLTQVIQAITIQDQEPQVKEGDAFEILAITPMRIDEDSTTEVISDNEQRLATKLKGLCDSHGVEVREHLGESAEVFLELGRLYLQKAKDFRGKSLQKLTYIRASTLLNGAKFRFELTKSNKRVVDTDNDLNLLYQAILDSAGCTDVEPSALVGIVTEVREQVNVLRRKAKPKVEEILPINETSQPENEQTRRERKKIRQVRALNKSNTQDYKELMSFISDRVVKILGKPHCRFAIAGLGSLAREEITLYSDFEHVILLENEIMRLGEEKIQSIREYFRWFAVIFQVVIIGLGETFIRSVGVKSINDLCSEDKTKNWFYDSYTKCAIAFDGMAPHSCNTPLGRLEPAKKKKHRVELIQTAEKMASFIRDEEALKNGYYLDDLLKITCFVYGMEDVYTDFCETRNAILRSVDVGDLDETRRIRVNTIIGIRSPVFLENSQRKYSVKEILYRPITVYTAYFGITNDVHESSTFDVITSLRDKGVFSDSQSHRLEYAMAVACEARMKCYQQVEQERNDMTLKEYGELVGQQSLAACKTALFDLKLKYWVGAGMDRPHPEILLGCGQLHEALKLGTINMEEIEQKAHAHTHGLESLTYEEKSLYMQSAHAAKEAYLALAFKEIGRQEEYLEKSAMVCCKMLQYPDSNKARRTLCYGTLAAVYHCQKKHEQVVEMTTKWFEKFNEDDAFNPFARQGKEMLQIRNKFLIYAFDIEGRKQTMENRKLLEYLKDKLEKETELKYIYLLRSYIAIQEISLGNLESGRRELLLVLIELMKNAQTIDRTSYSMLLNIIEKEQQKQGWTYDYHITAIEHYEFNKGYAEHSKDTLAVPPEEDRRLTHNYGLACDWRLIRGLPIDNKELSILQEYAKYTPTWQ